MFGKDINETSIIFCSATTFCAVVIKKPAGLGVAKVSRATYF